MKGQTFSFSLLAWGVALTGQAATTLELVDQEVRALFVRARPAVVKVHAERAPHPLDVRVAAAHCVGTGFFVDDRGRLLTTASVVDGAAECWIERDGQRVPARVVGRDLVTNVALLQANRAEDAPFPALTFGDSDELQLGSLVVAIGFGRDEPGAPMVGFVTGFDQHCGPRVFPTTHLRASCRLVPGQGGGPVLNARGELVGMALAQRGDDQCSILPARAVQRVCADLKEFGEVRYAEVGLYIKDRAGQVIVEQVNTAGPAAAAGFREGDIIARVATRPVRNAADVLHAIFFSRPGNQVAFTVQRNGQLAELTVTVAARPTVTRAPTLLPVVPAAGQP